MPPFALRCFLFALGLVLECGALAVAHQLSALKTHADETWTAELPPGSWEPPVTIDFRSALLRIFSLHRPGQTSGHPSMHFGRMDFRNVGSYRPPGRWERRKLDMMMLLKSPYDGNVSKNLINGDFAQINVGNSRTVDFECSLIYYEEYVLNAPKFNLSFWDLDMGKYGGVESITVGPISAYYITNESTVLAKQISETEWSFTATTIGKYIDNPHDTNIATWTDLNRAVVVEIAGGSRFHIKLSVGRSELESSHPESGRTFLFGGSSVQSTFEKYPARDDDAEWRAQWRKIPNDFAFPTGVKIALQSDTGNWMTRCRGCQKRKKYTPDTASVHVESPIVPAQFTVVNVGGGKIALKSDTGKYVARCHDCIPGGSLDSLAIHVDDPNLPIAQFTPEVQANGKFALKADMGKYVFRCSDCSPYAVIRDTITLDASSSSESRAQWSIYRFVTPE